MSGSSSRISLPPLSHPPSQLTAGESSSSMSSSNLIDLTVPVQPRIIHPSTLPSQSVEIIEINSEDETPIPGQNLISDDDDDSNESQYGDSQNDEVQFLRETPAVAGSARRSTTSDNPFRPELEDLLHRYFQETRAGDSLFEVQRLRAQGRQSWENRAQRRMLASINRNGRRPLRERVQSSGIWGASSRASGPASSQASQQRQDDPREGSSNFATFIPYIRLLSMGNGHQAALEHAHEHRPHPYIPQYLQRHQHYHHHPHNQPFAFDIHPAQPAFGDDIADFLPFFTNDEFPAPGRPVESDAELDEPEGKPATAPRPGYTKTLGRSVTVACPICKNELGYAGKEKTKLWVIIGCGHVICNDCIDGVFLTKVAIKSKKGRRQSISKPSKGKGKVKWTTPILAADMDQEMQALTDAATIASDGAAAAAAAVDPHDTSGFGAFKMEKKPTGNCPSCNRRIRRAAVQQLYL